MRSLPLAALLVALVLTSPARATTKPVLHMRSFAPISVRGTYFLPLERVTVTLDGAWIRRVRADASGIFVVTFRGVSVGRCDGFRITAVGSMGTSAWIRRPPLMCAATSPG